MYKPPYWFYKNVQFPEEQIQQVIQQLKVKNRELIVRDEFLLSSYFLKQHERPDKIWEHAYQEIMEGVVRQIGMYTTTRYIFEYWSQLYYRNVGHGPHQHSQPEKRTHGEISWVHFLKTPEEKNFMFLNQDGQVFIPEEQNDGDLICFPSYLWHQVLPNKSNTQRFVVAGNTAFIQLDEN